MNLKSVKRLEPFYKQTYIFLILREKWCATMANGSSYRSVLPPMTKSIHVLRCKSQQNHESLPAAVNTFIFPSNGPSIEQRVTFSV